MIPCAGPGLVAGTQINPAWKINKVLDSTSGDYVLAPNEDSMNIVIKKPSLWQILQLFMLGLLLYIAYNLAAPSINMQGLLSTPVDSNVHEHDELKAIQAQLNALTGKVDALPNYGPQQQQVLSILRTYDQVTLPNINTQLDSISSELVELQQIRNDIEQLQRDSHPPVKR